MSFFLQRHIAGEGAFSLGYFALLAMESLDYVGGVNNLSNLFGILKIST